MRGTILSLTLLLLIFTQLHVTDAAYRYCIDDSQTSRFYLRFESAEVELIKTTIRNRDRYLAAQRCSWEVLMKDLRQPRQLVLQPRTRPMPHRGAATKAATGANRSVCESKLSVQLMGNEFRATWHNGQSMPKAPLIVPVTNRFQMLNVSFTTGDAEPSENCERVELSIKVAVAGFCGRNMLLHRSSCHLISDRKLEMPDLDGTGLRLAAFSDMEDVRNLMRDNDLRVNQHPYKRPLDLRDPVRIGVFRCPPSMQAFYWKFSSGSCVAEPFNSTVQSAAELTRSSSPQCASVQAGGSGGMELRFSDCGEAKRSLLSFPETPQAVRDPCEALRPCLGTRAGGNGIDIHEHNDLCLSRDGLLMGHNSEEHSKASGRELGIDGTLWVVGIVVTVVLSIILVILIVLDCCRFLRHSHPEYHGLTHSTI